MDSELTAYRNMLELLSLDGYYFHVASTAHGFVLMANTNDVFCPAAAAYEIEPGDLEEVRALYVSAPNPDEPYEAVIQWIGRKIGMVPYAWRTQAR